MSCRTALLAGALLLAAGRISAQDPAAPQTSETWGSTLGYTTVLGYELRSLYTDRLRRGLEQTYCHRDDGVYPAQEAWAQLEVPDGASLAQLQFWAYDDDPNYGLTFELYESCQADGSPPSLTLIRSADTFGAIGNYFGFSPLSDYKVNARDCGYSVRVVFIPPDIECRDQSLQVRKIQVSWVRQVGPAPATATFADVPVGHALFQFVEALAKSGITSGCGNGNFCPGASLTRGQMAVFLAKGLGLSWP